MVKIYECRLEAMERIFFASSEFGKEYKTTGFIGNTALPYALDLVPVHHIHFDKPQHTKHFRTLVKEGIYVTPATFYDISFVLDRFNSISEKDGVSVMPNDRNRPNEGTFKLINRGSKGIFYILCEKELNLNRYIRLGKFMSKCKITQQEVSFSNNTGKFKSSLILRAEDIPNNIVISNYEKTNVQHGTYLSNLVMEGAFYDIASNYFSNAKIPSGIEFYAAN